MTITITPKHLKEMKEKLNERMYRIQKTFREEEEYNMACWEEDEFICTVSDKDILYELDRTYRMCDEIEWYIDNIKDNGFEVDSSDWFVEWNYMSRRFVWLLQILSY